MGATRESNWSLESLTLSACAGAGAAACQAQASPGMSIATHTSDVAQRRETFENESRVLFGSTVVTSPKAWLRAVRPQLKPKPHACNLSIRYLVSVATLQSELIIQSRFNDSVPAGV